MGHTWDWRTLDIVFFVLEWTILKLIWWFHQNKYGRLVIIILPIKNKNGCYWEAMLLCCFFFVLFCFVFFSFSVGSIELSLHLPSFKARGLQMIIALVYGLSRHSNLFAHHFVVNWLLQNGEKKNQHQESHQRETIGLHNKFTFFCKIGKVKRVNRVGKIRACVWDIVC